MNIDEFLVKLSETPRNWIRYGTAIRTDISESDRQCNCPISAVAELTKSLTPKEAVDVYCDPIPKGVELLSLERVDAAKIVVNADFDSDDMGLGLDKDLRRRLEKACGL